MRQPQPDAGDALERLLLPLAVGAAEDFWLQRGRLVEQRHQPRLELIGDEFLRWPDIEDRRRPVIQPLADDVEEALGLAGLRRGDQHHASVIWVAELGRERDRVGRQLRIALSGDAGLRAIDPVLGAPLARRLLPRLPG